MRSYLVRLVLAVSSLVIVAPAVHASPRVTSTPFLKACGTAVCLNGATVPLTAATTYGMLDQPDAAATLVQQAGLRMIRITNFIDEQASISAATSESKWVRVDKAIASAKAHQLLVEIDLSTYRNLLVNHNQDPYKADWSSFISFMANRKNTVTGVLYKNDPTIALVALAGEPEPINAKSNKLGVTTSELTGFYKRSLAELHQFDPSHMHSTGGFLQLNWNSGIDANAISALPYNDLPALHVYSTPDRDQVIPVFAARAAALNKPWWVEESGQPQTMGDSSRSAWLGAAAAAAFAHGAAGFGIWNVGPQTTGSNYDVNSHEPITWATVKGFTTKLRTAQLQRSNARSLA